MTLQTQAVSPSLMALLQTLMGEKLLSSFSLAGGTALALRFGHRESVDIDLFTEAPFEEQALAEKYANDSLWNIEKALVYFDDAENDPDPRDQRGQTWEEVKRFIRKADSL